MLRILFVFIALWFVYPPIQAQNAIEEYRQNRQTAYTHIRNLKNGALLVRLKTKDKTIEAYRKSGAFSLADKIEQEQKNENLLLMSMFKEYIDFCPIYFFYTHDTKKLQTGNTSGIFLNDNLQPDTSITLQTPNYYIAELDALWETLPDDDFTDTTEPKQPDAQPKTTKSPHSHTTLQRVIVIKNSRLEQLQRPFPFYVKILMDQFIHQKFEKLNRHLHRFYNQAVE